MAVCVDCLWLKPLELCGRAPDKLRGSAPENSDVCLRASFSRDHRHIERIGAT